MKRFAILSIILIALIKRSLQQVRYVDDYLCRCLTSFLCFSQQQTVTLITNALNRLAIAKTVHANTFTNGEIMEIRQLILRFRQTLALQQTSGLLLLSRQTRRWYDYKVNLCNCFHCLLLGK